MQFLTEKANIFLITANDITNNNLAACVRKIHKQILERNNTFNYVFIEGVPFRWEEEITRHFNWLHAQFDGKYIVHDMILPPEVFRAMVAKNGTSDVIYTG